MSLKWSEHFEFSMCGNIWMWGRANSTVLWNAALPTGIRPSLLICLLTFSIGSTAQAWAQSWFLVVCGPISGILIRAYCYKTPWRWSRRMFLHNSWPPQCHRRHLCDSRSVTVNQKNVSGCKSSSIISHPGIINTSDSFFCLRPTWKHRSM